MAEQTCLRCGASYEEGATVCFVCGAPIGEIETPTQPVRAPKRAPETVELPAISPLRGATSGAPRGKGARGAVSGARGAPGMRAATSGASKTALASRPGMGRISARGKLTPPPPARVRWPFYLVIGVVVLLFVGAGAVEVRALLAGPPIPKTQTYHDPQRRFNFTRPGLWQVTALPNGALLTDSAGVDSAQITVSPVTAATQASATTTPGANATPSPTAAPDVTAANTLATQLGLGARSVQPSQAFAGAVWQQREGQVTGADNVIREVDLLVTIHDDEVYAITLSSPITSFTSTNNLVYQPLLASFRFG